jgi:hypothetical protein
MTPNQEPDKYKLFNSITIGKKTHHFKPTYGKSIRLENGSVVIEAGESSVSYKIDQEPVERWERDKIIQISQDAKGNLVGLGKSGKTYCAHRYHSKEETKMMWISYIDNPSKGESK